MAVFSKSFDFCTFPPMERLATTWRRSCESSDELCARLGPCQDVAHRDLYHCVPRAVCTPSVGDLSQRSCPGAFELPNDRQDVGCTLIGNGFVCHTACRASASFGFQG